MIIPREGDKIRLYLQLTNADVIDPATGRVDMNRFGPDKLLEVRRTCRRSSSDKNRLRRKPKFHFQVAKKSFYPYIMTTTLDKIDWWTIYISERFGSSSCDHTTDCCYK